MAAIVGLMAQGARAFGPALGRLASAAIKYAPQIIDAGAQAAPLVGQGLDMLTKKFSGGKKNYNFAQYGSELKGAFDQRNREIQMTGGRGNRGRGGRQNLPLFEDEMDADEMMNQDNGNYTLNRRQFDRGGRGSFGGLDLGNMYSTFDEDEYDDTFDNSYGRQMNRGYKRPFDVYSERSFGNGYGRDSSIIASNELTRGGSGFDGMGVNRRRTYRYDEDEEDIDEEMIAPPPRKSFNRGGGRSSRDYQDRESRGFQRRTPSQSRNRFNADRINNLNYEEYDWSDLI